MMNTENPKSTSLLKKQKIYAVDYMALLELARHVQCTSTLAIILGCISFLIL
jgi:hypothetical protein